MKKGYIFSWFNFGRNYGQTLQAYALQRKLFDLGYYVEHVCFDSNRKPSSSPIRKYKDVKYLSSRERVIQNKFDKFISEKMKITKKLRNDKKVKRFIEKNKPDFIMCGSDQVWNPYNVNPLYYLYGVGNLNTKRIAYAVSTCDIRRKDKFMEYPEISEWINQIDYVFVREKTGQQIFAELYGVESEIVLDPTLLLTGKEWIEELKLEKKEENYILCYAFNLSDLQKNLISKRARELNCTIKYGNIIDSDDVETESWSPTDFLNAILNAREIFTDSFHGTVFSILFHKKFTVFDNGENIESDPYYNIDRMNTLLELLGLQERLINKDNEFVNSDIDYMTVDKILENRKDKCISLIRRSIG